MFFEFTVVEKLIRCSRRQPDGPQYLVSISYSVSLNINARANYQYMRYIYTCIDTIVVGYHLALTKPCNSKGRKKRANRGRVNLFGSAFDRRLRAHSTRARGGRRADCRRGAANFWAAGTGARRTFAAFLFSILARVNNNGLLLGHRRLEHILGKVRYGRALTLQHIVVHIGGRGTGRNTCLEDVFRQFGNRRAGDGSPAGVTGRILESFVGFHTPKHKIGKKKPKKKGNYKRF
jgi:hypothetical protein